MPPTPSSDTDHLLWLAELEAAVQHSPQDVSAWYDLGRGYCTADQFELAAEILAHAVRLAPRDPDTRARLGMTLIEAGNARAAIPHLQEALRLDPDHFARHRYDLGVAFDEAGQHAAAATHFRAAVDHAPGMAVAWIRLAWARSAQGHYLEAIPAFEKAIQHRPKSAPLWAGLGRAYAGSDQDLRAIQAYRLSFRNDPAQLDTLLALGACYERLGRVEEAHGAYRQAERIDPTSAAPLCALAALEATRQWVRVAPTSAAAHLELAKLFRQAARHDEAAREFIRAVELDPENPIALDELEAQLSLMGRLPDAESVLREVLRSQPGHGSLWHNLGRVLNRNLLFEPALSALQQATCLLPDSASAWRDLGWTYVCFLRNSEALAACRNALRLDPADADTWSLLGYVLDMERDGEGVREALHYLRHLDPRQARDFQETRVKGRPWGR